MARRDTSLPQFTEALRASHRIWGSHIHAKILLYLAKFWRGKNDKNKYLYFQTHTHD